LDKLVDELAKGKSMEKILRSWFKHNTYSYEIPAILIFYTAV
jgi:hypothetical protein